MRFQIDPLPGETARGCTAIAQASLPTSQATAIMIATILGIYVASRLLTPTTQSMTSLIAIFAIAFMIGLSMVERSLRLRRLRRNDPHALETHFVELDQQGVRSWCSHVDARYAWQDYLKVIENKEFYLLVRSTGNGALIPKRILDKAQEEELRVRISEWSPDRGSGLTVPE
jgi:hypothetical protein